MKDFLRLNCIRNEIGWIDLNECQDIQFRTQTDLNSILKRKLHDIRENSSIYFVSFREGVSQENRCR